MSTTSKDRKINDKKITAASDAEVLALRSEMHKQGRCLVLNRKHVKKILKRNTALEDGSASIVELTEHVLGKGTNRQRTVYSRKVSDKVKKDLEDQGKWMESSKRKSWKEKQEAKREQRLAPE